MTEWLKFPENTPIEGEPLLVAALTINDTSVVQFGKYHPKEDNGYRWELFEPLEAAVITHFLHIPALPSIHHKYNRLIN